MAKTTDSLVRLAMAGASLEVAGKTADSMVKIAMALQGNATLTVLDGADKTTETLVRLCLAAPGKIIIRSAG